MNLYISNLGESITDESLNATFSTYGTVSSAKVIVDGFTGYPRGFAFVDMPDDTEAKAAILRLNGSIINGRAIEVQEARPKTEHKGSYAVRNRSDK